MDLKDKTTTELKALAYDILASIEQLKNKLNTVNSEIIKKNIEHDKTIHTETPEK